MWGFFYIGALLKLYKMLTRKRYRDKRSPSPKNKRQNCIFTRLNKKPYYEHNY